MRAARGNAERSTLTAATHANSRARPMGSFTAAELIPAEPTSTDGGGDAKRALEERTLLAVEQTGQGAWGGRVMRVEG